jgi:TolB-like protein/Tfp pilus assembly protein PilF
MPDGNPAFIVFGPFRLDRAGRRLTRGGNLVPLGGRAFDLLCLLAVAGGEVVTKDELLTGAWRDQRVDENNLQIQISALRRALGTATIATVTGRGYRLAVTPQSQDLPASDTTADAPTLAVLPFSNIGGSPEDQFVADGIADDLITELSKAQSFLVIARTSSFRYRESIVDVRRVANELNVRYVLIGAVRRDADRVRVTTQLVDATTLNNLWADKFDRPLSDLFAMLDDIAYAVAAAITPLIAAAELRRVLRKPPDSLSAWEAYQRGLWHYLTFRLEEFPTARALFSRAVEIDPALAAGYTALAWLQLSEAGYYGLVPFEEAAALSADLARKAVALNPRDAEGHAALAFALYNQGSYDAASYHVERSLAASPSCSGAYQVSGMSYLFAEETAKAREHLTIAYRLDPRGIHSVATIPTMIAESYYFDRDYERAAKALRRAIADNPSNPMAYRWLTAALGQLGRTEEAHAALQWTTTQWPDSFRQYTARRAPFFPPKHFRAYAGWLFRDSSDGRSYHSCRATGWPQESRLDEITVDTFTTHCSNPLSDGNVRLSWPGASAFSVSEA